jgi:hypothetical protein
MQGPAFDVPPYGPSRARPVVQFASPSGKVEESLAQSLEGMALRSVDLWIRWR